MTTEIYSEEGSYDGLSTHSNLHFAHAEMWGLGRSRVLTRKPTLLIFGNMSRSCFQHHRFYGLWLLEILFHLRMPWSIPYEFRHLLNIEPDWHKAAPPRPWAFYEISQTDWHFNTEKTIIPMEGDSIGDVIQVYIPVTELSGLFQSAITAGSAWVASLTPPSRTASLTYRRGSWDALDSGIIRFRVCSCT